MCLAVPGKIIEIKSEIVTVDYGAEKRKAKFTSKNYKKGDYVIIQGGVAVQKVDKKEAVEALKMYQKFLRE